MQKHVKIYMRFFMYDSPDEAICETPGCHSQVVDVHHMNKRGPGRDRIEWLMGGCRSCHDDWESGRVTKHEQMAIHQDFVEGFHRTAYEPDWNMFVILPPGTVLKY